MAGVFGILGPPDQERPTSENWAGLKAKYLAILDDAGVKHDFVVTEQDRGVTDRGHHVATDEQVDQEEAWEEKLEAEPEAEEEAEEKAPKEKKMKHYLTQSGIIYRDPRPTVRKWNARLGVGGSAEINFRWIFYFRTASCVLDEVVIIFQGETKIFFNFLAFSADPFVFQCQFLFKRLNSPDI